MDLPTCPACGQSVLDDDVDECPFCGASMSGKPSAAPPKPAATATAAAPSRTQPKSPSSAAKAKPAAAPKAEPKPASDDPFELERTADAKKKVVQLRPRPEPGRRHPVTCPMCETVGYTATKAAGVEVRCANPECRLPLFVAPPLKDAGDSEESAAKPKGPVTPKRILIGSAAAIAVVAAAIFLWREPQAPENKNGPVQPSVNKTNGDNPPKKKKSDVKTNVAQRDPRGERLAMRKKSLNVMVENAGDPSGASHLKPFAWQMTFTAHAGTGNLDSLTDQLKPLRTVTSQNPFLRTVPLVAVAWAHLERNTADDGKKAESFLKEAVEAAQTLPPRDPAQRPHDFYDLVTELTAILYATGRAPQAEKLIADYNDDTAGARKSLFLQRVWLLNEFDADLTFATQPAQPAASPPRVGVTLLLAAHGRWKQSWNWAKSQQNPQVRDDCLIAWAEFVYGRGAAASADTSLPQPDAVAAQLSGVATRGTLFARLAEWFADRKKPAEAAAALAKARTALQGVSPGSEPKTPDIKAAFAFVPLSSDETAARRRIAFALVELARAELRVDPKNAKSAWTALSRSLAAARSLSPSPVAVAKLKDGLVVPGSRAVRNQLATMFGLNTDDAIDSKFKEYRSKVREIGRAAARRDETAERVVLAAIHWGDRWKAPDLLESLWKELDARTRPDGNVGREDWFATRAPWLLAAYLKFADHPDSAAAIEKSIAASKRAPSSVQQAWQSLQTALRNKRFDDAADALSGRGMDAVWSNEQAWRVATSLTNSGNSAGAFRFVGGLRDPYVRLEAMSLAAARTAFLDRPNDVWDATLDQAVTPAQRVAALYGLVQGMMIPPEPPRKKSKQ